MKKGRWCGKRNCVVGRNVPVLMVPRGEQKIVKKENWKSNSSVITGLRRHVWMGSFTDSIICSRGSQSS